MSGFKQTLFFECSIKLTNNMLTSSLLLIITFHQKLCRNRNKDLAKRTQVHTEHEKLLFNTVIKDLANSNTKCFHSLIELSTTQWKRYGDNCICVSGMKEQKLTKCNTVMKYSTVAFGKKLRHQKTIYRSKGRLLIANVCCYKIDSLLMMKLLTTVSLSILLLMAIKDYTITSNRPSKGLMVKTI